MSTQPPNPSPNQYKASQRRPDFVVIVKYLNYEEERMKALADFHRRRRNFYAACVVIGFLLLFLFPLLTQGK